MPNKVEVDEILRDLDEGFIDVKQAKQQLAEIQQQEELVLMESILANTPRMTVNTDLVILLTVGIQKRKSNLTKA